MEIRNSDRKNAVAVFEKIGIYRAGIPSVMIEEGTLLPWRDCMEYGQEKIGED